MNGFLHAVTVVLFCSSVFATGAVAADGGEQDNSGTNPVRFTHDFRIYMETMSLPGGDHALTKTTFEFRVPLSERLAFRTRIPHATLSIDGGSTTTGLGDIDARLLYLPVIKKSWALATGLEAFFNTATHDLLGSGKTSLGPQIFFVKFAPFGLKGALLAPAYQYVFDVAGSDARPDVRRHGFDLFGVWLAPSKKNWVVINPQYVIDEENSSETLQLETELGQMMFGATSSYIRPGMFLAGDEAYDWSVEVGFKVIWP